MLNDYDMAQKLNESFENWHEYIKSKRGQLSILRMMKEKVEPQEIVFGEVKSNLDEIMSQAFKVLAGLGLDFEEKVHKVFENDQTLLNAHAEDKTRNSVGLNQGVVEVDLNPPSDSSAVVVVAHEFGHMLDESVQIREPQKYAIFGEVSAMFVERVAVEFLHTKGIIDDAEYEKFGLQRLQNFNHAVERIEAEDELLVRFGYPISASNIEQTERNFAGRTSWGRMKHTMQSVSNEGSQYFKRVQFVAGYLISDILISEYMQNPENTVKNFKEFVEHNGGFDSAIKNENEYMKTNLKSLFGDKYQAKLANKLQSYLRPKENV